MISRMINGRRVVEGFAWYCVEHSVACMGWGATASLRGRREDRGSLNNIRQFLHSKFAFDDVDAPADRAPDGCFAQLW